MVCPSVVVTPGSKTSGAWDSIHVFEATDRARMSHYKLTSTVILHLSNETEALGEMDLSGNMTRQIEADMPVENDASHVANVGRLVEDMELKMRNLLRESTRFCRQQTLVRGLGGMGCSGMHDFWSPCADEDLDLQRKSTLERQRTL